MRGHRELSYILIFITRQVGLGRTGSKGRDNRGMEV